MEDKPVPMDEVMAGLDPEFREKKPPTKAEYKKAMRVLFTQRHQLVDRCGHKFHPTDAPRTNCDDCWIAYFQVHGEITKLCDEIFREQGFEVLARLKSKKYAKNFVRFMAGLAQYQKEKTTVDKIREYALSEEMAEKIPYVHEDQFEQSVGDVSNSSGEEGRTEGSISTTDTSGEMEDAGGGWKATTEGL